MKNYIGTIAGLAGLFASSAAGVDAWKDPDLNAPKQPQPFQDPDHVRVYGIEGNASGTCRSTGQMATVTTFGSENVKAAVTVNPVYMCPMR